LPIQMRPFNAAGGLVGYSNTTIGALRDVDRLFGHHAVRKLVAFYVVQHNEVMPRVMLGGRTPDEVYLGLNPNISMQLTNERQKARVDRINHNRAQRCGQCSGLADAQNMMLFRGRRYSEQHGP
jgi:hypothetical protein